MGVKKKLDEAKRLLDEQFHEVLWSYHTTPHSTIKEASFTMVYDVDTMLPVEIDTPTWWCSRLNGKENGAGQWCVADLIDEMYDVTHITEFSTKQRATIRYNSKVVLREMQEGDLVHWWVVVFAQQGKLQPNWEWSYCIFQKLLTGLTSSKSWTNDSF